MSPAEKVQSPPPTISVLVSLCLGAGDTVVVRELVGGAIAEVVALSGFSVRRRSPPSYLNQTRWAATIGVLIPWSDIRPPLG